MLKYRDLLEYQFLLKESEWKSDKNCGSHQLFNSKAFMDEVEQWLSAHKYVTKEP